MSERGHGSHRACDVVIVGAGPAGSAAALSLARRGVRVALLERSSFDTPRIGEALAPAVQGELAALGAWRDVLRLGPLPSWGTRSVWGTEDSHSQSHLISPYVCGWHVDRRAFDETLARAAQRAGADLLLRATLRGCDWRDGAWQLEVAVREETPGAAASAEYVSSEASVAGGAADDASVASDAGDAANGARGSAAFVRLGARVLIDATGRAAAIGRALGALRLPFDRLVGVATCWEPDHSDERGHLLVEAAGDGWWYSARLPPGARNVPGEAMLAMLMTDADLCARGRQHRRQGWHAALEATHATRQRLRGARCLDQPSVYLAHSQRLQRSDRAAPQLLPWLAVGDAALAIDPLSGSGVVRALRSGRAGADTAAHLLEHPREGRGALAAYEAARDAECTTFLIERAQRYATERRFDTPFWNRRKVTHRLAPP